ncbi:MAG: hypothetical protein P1V34_14440 [Alphaproteobacteria bacterium]|nr:hypothetical protein [Alphaproteobacteria bacterium]
MIQFANILKLLLCVAFISIPLLHIAKTAQGQGQEFLRRIPEMVQPEPYKTTRTKVGGTRVNYPVDPQTLSQALSKPLSEACARLEFNLSRHGRYFVVVPRPNQDPLRVGYAKGNGLNIRDPKGLRVETSTYLFERDETSECKVYVYP